MSKEERLARELAAAFKRLAAPGARTARRNARREMSGLLRRIKNYVEHEYPMIDKDGKEKRIPRADCPVCGLSLKGWTSLAQHVAGYHGREHPDPSGYYESLYKCWCGWSVGRRLRSMNAGDKDLTTFGRHLAGVKDLKTHVLLGALEEL
jgi:hypothetical protein